jgi:hypothetical protein
MKRTRSERDDADDGVAGAALDPTSALACDVPPCDAGVAGAAYVESPEKKRQRVTTRLETSMGGGSLVDLQSAMEQEHEQEQEEEWNLLRHLPYVVLRRLLDFLSFSPSTSPTASPAGTSLYFIYLFIFKSINFY